MLEQSDITAKMGHKPLPPRAWAKGEVLLGSAAEITGVLYAGYHTIKLAQDQSTMLPIIGGAVLYVLGKYLHAAGNRSMIYRSLNEQTAYLEGIVKND